MKVLEVGGVPVTIIAEKCGTPVYIYDEAAEPDRKSVV